jgi:hypothetical protein
MPPAMRLGAMPGRRLALFNRRLAVVAAPK